MPLQATSGAASYDAFGGGVPFEPTYIEQIFSTWLYTGNGSTQTITNGIDLAGEGGAIWFKSRSNATDHRIFDTVRGRAKALTPNTTAAEGASSAADRDLISFNAEGFSLGIPSNYDLNTSDRTYASWTFRKQPKFFDVVTFTGTGSVQNIAHNLGSVPAVIITKKTSGTNDWYTYHRSLNGGVNPEQYFVELNNLSGTQGPNSNFWNNTAPTDSVFTIGTAFNSGTYVAYLFAHNAGGFGLTGTDNVISCGSFTTNGSSATTVTLGYEPQWVLVKQTNDLGSWVIVDNMRGMVTDTTGNNQLLLPNTSGAEISTSGWANPTSTGFTNFRSAGTYIYIAIRRGPMKVPTTGTSVFSPQTATGVQTTNFVVDAFIGVGNRASPSFFDPFEKSRLQGGVPYLTTSSTAAETSGSDVGFDSNTGVKLSWGAGVNWYFQRAPGFFDEVCYTGDGGFLVNYAHNLTVRPELVISKRRNSTNNWAVAVRIGNNSWVTSNATGGFVLNSTASTVQVTSYDAFFTPTHFGPSYIGGGLESSNTSGATYVAYLFASCPGVSKVGRYTGNGTTQAIACGFTGGARFVLIKRTDASGDWYVYDTARGMTVLTDPYLLLNSTAAETATLGSVITSTGGFTVNAAILAAINTNAASYIFLAIS